MSPTSDGRWREVCLGEAVHLSTLASRSVRPGAPDTISQVMWI
jgi:hypothetical protein